ncbi:MAG TPA: succinate--CoA ligase subunit alpha, partial [Candidatus Binatia bacterium]|nr:succinate--CoA ligase subunit alpha [Candidatus Binatia bacterium]
LVAGVAPGRGGTTIASLPVFDTVAEARAATGAAASVAFLPPAAAGEGLMEAAEAGLELVAMVTEGAPLHDMLPALELARLRGTAVVGPNSPGLLVPGRLLMGFLPHRCATPGPCAVLSRSGTLSYEVVSALTAAGVGQSLWLGVGGDELRGVTFAEVVPQLLGSTETHALVLVGEIGGTDEEDAAAVLAGAPIPTVAIVAGRTAPPGVRMGHAGALIAGASGTYETKRAALAAAGVSVATRPSEIPDLVRDALRQ